MGKLSNNCFYFFLQIFYKIQIIYFHNLDINYLQLFIFSIF